MARDLIPPPSPAGRPSADPEPAGEPARGETPAAPPAGARAATASGPSPFRARFGFLFGALLGILVCAGVGFGVLLGAGPAPRGGVQLAEHWSAWQPPSADPAAGAAAIAQHVASSYRLDDGKQLVGVSGGPLEVQSVPLTVALSLPDGAVRDYGSDGVLYTLRGTGSGGQIADGAPSTARYALLRREALELALYSFRYLDGIKQVVALLPPAYKASDLEGKGAGARVKKGAQGEVRAVFYRPGDLEPQLESPLAQTLDPGRMRPKTLGAAERRRIDALTQHNVFAVDYQVAQNRQPYMVLTPPSG